MGALKGVILDADGSRLYDLFDDFDITAKSVNFALNVETTNVKAKCADVLRHVEDHLIGEFMSGIHCLVSPEFFEKLTGHPKVEKAYENWQQGAVLINDMRAGFTFGGLTFEEYRGTDLHTQSNPLPMCHRPGVLVKLLAQ